MPDNGVTLEQARDWRRQLERDRLSMMAYDEAGELPGPGAAAKKNESKKGYLDAASMAARGEMMKAIKGAAGALRTRISLWSNMPTLWFPFPLIALHAHKLARDGRFKDAGKKIQNLSKQYKVPVPAAGKIFTKITLILLAEWIIIGLIDLILAAIVGLLVASIVIIYLLIWCSVNPIECLVTYPSLLNKAGY